LRALILLVVLCVSTGPVFAQPASDAESRRIREIRFFISDVYTEEELQESSWAKSVNKFHMTTRESVIRSQILFSKGDVLDIDLIEQSERRLRRFAFLNKAQITVVPVDDQSVDIEIRTHDAWSLVPGLTFGGGGDLYTVNAELNELNLLGYGKTAFVEGNYQSDIEDWTIRSGYRDPQVFSSRWVGSATYTNGPLVEAFFVSAKKPLYSIDSEWSFGGHAYVADKIIRRFEEGEESSRFGKDQITVLGRVKRAFGERYEKTTANLSLQYLKNDFSVLDSATTEPPPPNQANVTPLVGVSKNSTSSWEKYTYLDKMGLLEDTRLGHSYGTHVGYGIPVEDGFELWDVGAFYASSKTFKHKQLLKTTLTISSEVVRKHIALAKLRYYKKYSGHTVATRFQVNYGSELDNLIQFTLGADSGLRGYPARKFTGEKLMLINLEDRQFWGEYRIGPKIALGTVVFVDVGNVWKEDEDVDLNDLNWSAGAGLRLGWSSLPHQPIFRIDFGWALGQDDFAVTVGSEQHF